MICGRLQLGGPTQPNSPSHHHLQTRDDDTKRGRSPLFIVQLQFYLFWGGICLSTHSWRWDAQQTLLPFPPHHKQSKGIVSLLPKEKRIVTINKFHDAGFHSGKNDLTSQKAPRRNLTYFLPCGLCSVAPRKNQTFFKLFLRYELKNTLHHPRSMGFYSSKSLLSQPPAPFYLLTN